MLSPSTVTNRSLLRTATFMIPSSVSAPGDFLPGQELQPSHAGCDVGFAVGDLLGFRAARAAEDDHAGAEALAGIVKERAGADQHALFLEVMNEGVMQIGELLLRQRVSRTRLDQLVVDDPTLLALDFAHCP